MTIGRLLRLWVVMSVCWVLAIGAITTWLALDNTREVWLSETTVGTDTWRQVCFPPIDETKCSHKDFTMPRAGLIKIGVALAFAPPIVVLVLGLAFAWVVGGFRHQQPKI